MNVLWTFTPASGFATDGEPWALMRAFHGAHPVGDLQSSKFAPGEFVERSGMRSEESEPQVRFLSSNQT